jgi:hypothetical protein
MFASFSGVVPSPSAPMSPTTRPRAPVLDTVSWVWVVVHASSASGSQAVEAVFAVERAAREYIASQGWGHDLSVQAHRLHQDAPAPLYGLLARSARIIAELATDGSVCAVEAAHADADGIAEAGPRWNADIQARTHMDLRRWLDRCLCDGLLELQLCDLPSGSREPEGDKLLVASDGGRTVERVLRAAEQEWLLAGWPAELREPDAAGGAQGGGRGRLS